MIAEIRSYVDSAVKSVDSTLKAYTKDLFGNNDVTKNQAVNNYNLIIGSLTHSDDGEGFNQTIPCTLDLYSKSVRDIKTSFDDLYEKAISVSHCLIDPAEVNGQAFSMVIMQGIEPIEQDTNDNAIKMRLSFIIRTDFRH